MISAVLIVAQQAPAAQAPVAKIAVVKPQAGQHLSGRLEVSITFETPEGATAPAAAFAGLGGAPWTELKQTAGHAEWTAEIDSTLVPNGGQKLIGVTDNRKVSISIDVTVENPLKVFFADLHSHTSYSDGTLRRIPRRGVQRRDPPTRFQLRG